MNNSYSDTPRMSVPHLTARINKIINGSGNTKAYVSLIIGGTFIVHGFRVMNSEKGLFVCMPATKYMDNNGEEKYKDSFNAISKEGYKQIQDTVLAAYNKKVNSQLNTEYADMSHLDLPFDV